jgi:hypothetical protein
MQDPLNPQQLYETLKRLTNAVDQPLLRLDLVDEVKLSLRPDRSVSPAKFRPDPLIPGGYLAHPVTLRAVRKELFSVGAEEFLDLETLIVCESCRTEIDAQFWHFCPFCEASFKISSKN